MIEVNIRGFADADPETGDALLWLGGVERVSGDDMVACHAAMSRIRRRIRALVEEPNACPGGVYAGLPAELTLATNEAGDTTWIMWRVPYRAAAKQEG